MNLTPETIQMLTLAGFALAGFGVCYLMFYMQGRTNQPDPVPSGQLNCIIDELRAHKQDAENIKVKQSLISTLMPDVAPAPPPKP